MDTEMRANASSRGWDYIDGRRDVPGVVAQVRETGEVMTVGLETAVEVEAWIMREGWEPDNAPILLESAAP